MICSFSHDFDEITDRTNLRTRLALALTLRVESNTAGKAWKQTRGSWPQCMQDAQRDDAGAQLTSPFSAGQDPRPWHGAPHSWSGLPTSTNAV